MIQLNDWLSIDKAVGEGDDIITLTATSSKELEERVASLKINGINITSLVSIKQDALIPSFTITPTPIILTSDGEEVEITITGNVSWELVADEWVTISNKYGNVYDEPLTKTIKISASLNTGDFRECDLKVKAFASDVVFANVKIMQEAFDATDYVQMIYETTNDNETLYLFNESANGYLTKNVGSSSSAIWRNSDKVKIIVIDGSIYIPSDYSFTSPLRDGFIMPNAGEHYVYVKFTDDTINPSMFTSSSYPAFYENSQLKSITIPPYYETKGNNSGYGLFCRCDKLQYVNMNGVLSYIGTKSDSELQAKAATFRGCESLETVLNFRLEDSVLQYSLCSDCKSLKTFTIYNDEIPKNIGDYAFANCKNLSNDFLINYIHNKEIYSIGMYAFSNCKLFEGENGVVNLSNIRLGSGSFGYCNFKTVYANEGYNAFNGCGETLYILGTNPWGISNSTFRKVICMGLLNPFSTNWLSSNYLEEIEFMSEEQQDMRYESSDGKDWNGKFNEIPNLKKITFHSMLPPIINYNTFEGVPYNGTLVYPKDADYSQLTSTDEYYLGYYNWTFVEK